VLGALALVAAVMASPARGDVPAVPPGPLPLVCLPFDISFVRCPQASPQSSEPKPIAVAPTEVHYDPRRIIVGFKRRTPPETVEQVLTRAGVKRERTLTAIRLYVVKAAAEKRDEALASLRRSGAVVSVEREQAVENFETVPNDPDWPDQWGLRTAGFPKAWDITRGSRRVVIAVLDTGVDSKHPDLRGALVPGRDIVHGDADPFDDNGHGTAVAGVVAARSNNGLGLTGACWSCSVMPVKVLGADGTGTTADVAAGILWAANHGANVINLSLGAPGTTDALSAAVAYAVSKDVVLVASAGNSSTNIPFYPAADGGVIGVAATNEQDQLYSWSNHGAWIQVAAPGCTAAPWPNEGYVGFCGTSAAAPLVAGVAGLIRSARPLATAEQTADAIGKAVDPVNAEVRRGRINAALALDQVVRSAQAVSLRKTFHGQLDSRIRSRRHEFGVGAGRLSAVLTFSGAERMTLVLHRAQGGVVRVSGTSPLRIRRAVAAGTMRFVVVGNGTKAAYRLYLSAAAP
jgi:subtilisin family serine protease